MEKIGLVRMCNQALEGLPHPEVWRAVDAWLDAHSEHRSPRGSLGWDSVAVLVGPSGTGKSYGIRRLLAARGWDIVELNQDNTPTAKDLPDMVRKGITTNLLQALSGNIRPRVLLVDNADALLQNERTYVQHLADLLGASTTHGLPHVPMLLTCSYATEKRLGPIRNRCPQFVFRALPEQDLFLWLRRCYPERSVNDLMAAAESAQGRPAAALSVLLPGGSRHTRQDVVAEAPMLYEARDGDVRQVRALIADRLWMAPLLFHENVPAELDRRRGSHRAKMDYYRSYLWTLATWDVWMAAGEACEEPNVELITRAILRMGARFPRKRNAGEPVTETFTRLFSTLSIQKKNARAAYRS